MRFSPDSPCTAVAKPRTSATDCSASCNRPRTAVRVTSASSSDAGSTSAPSERPTSSTCWKSRTESAEDSIHTSAACS